MYVDPSLTVTPDPDPVVTDPAPTPDPDPDPPTVPEFDLPARGGMPAPDPESQPEPEPAPEPPTDIDPPDTIDRSADPEPVVGTPDRTAPDSGDDGGVTDQTDRSADPEPVLGADGATQTPQDAAESATDAAEQVTDSADDAMTGDLGGGLQPGESPSGDVPEDLPNPRRITMRDAVADRASEQTGVRVNPSDVTLEGQVVTTDEGYRLEEGGSARLDAGVQERVVAKRIERERGIDASASDVYVDGDDVAVRGETRAQLDRLNAAGLVGGTTEAQRERLDRLDRINAVRRGQAGASRELREQQMGEVSEFITDTGAEVVTGTVDTVTDTVGSVFGLAPASPPLDAPKASTPPAGVPDREGIITNPTTSIQITAAPGTTGAADRAIQQSGDPVAGFIGDVGGAIAGSPVGQAVLGPPGREEQFVRGKAEGVADFSGDVATGFESQIVDPAAGVAGQGVGEVNTLLTRPDLFQESMASQDAGDVGVGVDTLSTFIARPDRLQDAIESQDVDIETDRGVERAATNFSREVGLLGADLIRAPQTGVAAANVGGSATNVFIDAVKEEGVAEGTAESLSAAGGTAIAVGGAFAEQARANPAQTAGMLAGGVATAAVSPFRLTTRRIPTGRRTDVDLNTEAQAATRGVETEIDPTRTIMESTGSTTVRGVRVQTPWLAEQAGFRMRGRTLFGTRGGRPTTGAPSLQPMADDLDLSRMGATATGAFEPGDAFEADIVRSTASDIGDTASARFSTAEGLQTRAQLRPQTGFTVESAEEAIGEARAVPESAVGDVADALRETDATVFGSAAARAQLDEFRQPRDLDIVVPDKSEATPRLADALEGEGASVGDVFDIKEVDDVPGRARGGEPIKFGRISRTPQELDDIPFNPVEEELVRKSGASAFLRQPGTAGTPDLDIGPEPRRAGRADVRLKDPEDAAMMAGELGVSGRRVGQFERAFDLGDGQPASRGSVFGPVGDRLRFDEFAGDVRGQAGAGNVFARSTDEVGGRPRGDINADDAGRRIRDRDIESPDGATANEGLPLPGASPPSPGARSGGFEEPGFPPSSPTPEAGRSGLQPLPVVGGPDGGGFGIPEFDMPFPGFPSDDPPRFNFPILDLPSPSGTGDEPPRFNFPNLDLPSLSGTGDEPPELPPPELPLPDQDIPSPSGPSVPGTSPMTLADPVTSPGAIVDVPGVRVGDAGRRRLDGFEGDAPERDLQPLPERAPETTPFTNPIAGVFDGLFGGDGR